ncbi:MAG: DUF2147 domain-containing protein [Ferruginibacter sp.]
MKFILLIAGILTGFATYAQHRPDAIVGKWIVIPKENFIINVYHSTTGYSGKIASVKEQSKANTIGFVIIDGLKFDPKTGSWDKGKIHNPNNRTKYNASAKIKPDGVLEVRGSGAIKFIGAKRNFRRVQ